jgi:hypothetical protein|tara:strand:- start:4435 stop:4689 length:255 start_codon:yes stop_codon:yes gene_type:complete
MGFLTIGLKLFPYIMTAIESIERCVKARSEDKENAAVAVVHSILQTVETGVDKDLLNDEDVNRATRDVMRAVVSLQNVISRKQS